MTGFTQAGCKEIPYNYITKHAFSKVHGRRSGANADLLCDPPTYFRWLANAMCLEGEECGRILLLRRTNSSHACCCFIIQLYFSALSEGFLSPDNAICYK